MRSRPNAEHCQMTEAGWLMKLGRRGPTLNSAHLIFAAVCGCEMKVSGVRSTGK